VAVGVGLDHGPHPRIGPPACTRQVVRNASGWMVAGWDGAWMGGSPWDSGMSGRRPRDITACLEASSTLQWHRSADARQPP
jgi:hypothetical protein